VQRVSSIPRRRFVHDEAVGQRSSRAWPAGVVESAERGLCTKLTNGCVIVSEAVLWTAQTGATCSVDPILSRYRTLGRGAPGYMGRPGGCSPRQTGGFVQGWIGLSAPAPTVAYCVRWRGVAPPSGRAHLLLARGPQRGECASARPPSAVAHSSRGAAQTSSTVALWQ